MQCNKGDIVLIKFPFTTLSRSKKRPVLVIKSENEYHDFVCFQITSKKAQINVLNIQLSDLHTGDLKLISYVKYDKCFTLNTELVDKKLACVNEVFLAQVQKLFCDDL